MNRSFNPNFLRDNHDGFLQVRCPQPQVCNVLLLYHHKADVSGGRHSSTRVIDKVIYLPREETC